MNYNGMYIAPVSIPVTVDSEHWLVLSPVDTVT